ncbi:tyrosine-protein kinase SYK [Clonorchis sinensis]|uniref:Tyrosine-protein kinase n=1 Tax=Clonorchis sinensis TaxID=79923 RepID=G7Y9W6_CLOSI|nr:tyrosine-protein kinase SYK [Clonorchis sinensis]
MISAHLLPLLPGAVPPESTLYFHGKITREQAEDQLVAHGAAEGLFLLRESVNRNYVISICHLNRVHHYNVERQQDASYRIQTGHRFLGPVELVQHHSMHLDGFLTLARLPLNRPEGMSPLLLQGLHLDEFEQKLRLKAIEMGLKGRSVDEALGGPMRDHIRYLVLKELHVCQPWYHHCIGRREAERRLVEVGSLEGSFLVKSKLKITKAPHTTINLQVAQEKYFHKTTIPKEDCAVQTNMSSAVSSWNGSQSLPSLSSAPLIAASNGAGEASLVESSKLKQDLISFADWPNVTRLLASNQTKSNGNGGPGTMEDRPTCIASPVALFDTSPFPPSPFTPTTPVADPLADVTPVPNCTSTNPLSVLSLSKVTKVDTSTVASFGTANGLSNIFNSPLLFCHNQRPEQQAKRTHYQEQQRRASSGADPRCLEPVRLSDPPVGRATADVNVAIANIVSGAFAPPTREPTHPSILQPETSPHSCCPLSNTPQSTTQISHSLTKLANFGSDRSLNDTCITATSSTEAPPQSLHFPPILDSPWEEPDCNEDSIPTNSGGSSCSGCSVLLAAPPLPLPSTCCTNPFLPQFGPQYTPSPGIASPIISQSHSPDVSTFFSAACCAPNSHRQRRRASSFSRSPWSQDMCQENTQMIYDELPPSTFLLSSHSVILKERLGGGNFGHVVKGVYRTPTGQDIPVAVKTLKPDQLANTGEREILAEARTMAQLKHRHIVRLIGVCKDEQLMLVLELAPLGPINKYLKKRPDVPIHTLTELMYQVALGMAYLESCKFVHRDLAARNVLLVTRHFAKISDFGMSKALNFGSDYYRAATAGKWPLKWYAPECIYYFRFDSKSDVWSYGITLWEVYSYGERPYRDMKGAQILAMLDQGLRLSKPSRCPESIYGIMQQCWHFEGVRRPTFAELVLTLSRILKVMPLPAPGGLGVVDSKSQVHNAAEFSPTRRLDLRGSGSGGSGANSGASDGPSF